MKTLITWLAILTLALPAGFAAPSRQDLIDSFRLGAVISDFDEEEPDFAIDSTTLDDLGIKETIFPLFLPMFYTDLGRNRFKWIISHILRDADKTRERQEAIQELANNSELLNTLTTFFEELKHIFNLTDPAQTEGLDFNFLITSKEDHRHKIKTDYAIGLSTLFISTFAGVLVFNSPAGSAAKNAVLKLWSAGKSNDFKLQVDGNSATLLKMEKSLILAQKVNKLLQDSHSKLLNSIGLGCAITPGTPLCRTLRTAFLAGVDGNLRTFLVNLIGIVGANLRAHAHRTIMKNNLEVAKVLSLIGQLEYLVVAAQYYKRHSDQLIFPIVENSDRPFVNIQGARHPQDIINAASSPKIHHVDLSADRTQTKTLLLPPLEEEATKFERVLALAYAMSLAGLPIPAISARLSPMGIISFFNHEVNFSGDELKITRTQWQRFSELTNLLQGDQAFLILTSHPFGGTDPNVRAGSELTVVEALHNYPNVLSINAIDHPLTAVKAGSQPGIEVIPLSDLQTILPHTEFNDVSDFMASLGIPEKVIAANKKNILNCLAALTKQGSER